MQFLNILNNMSKSLLEQDGGCCESRFKSLVEMLRFFEYNNLADNLIRNTKQDNNLFYCENGVCDVLFGDYV